MAWLRWMIVTVVVVLGMECVPSLHAAPAPAATPPQATEVVEEHWADGRLRMRKHVLRREDGTTVDHGTFERWFADGVKEYEAVFVHGKKDGTTRRYHRNGRLARHQEYRDGLRHGPSISWNDAGEKIKEEHWADGRPHGIWTVWNKGKRVWTHTYDHGDPTP